MRKLAWFFGLAWVALLFCQACLAQKSATPVEMRVQKISEHAYYVQGLSEVGSASNHNFISNAGFVITPEGVLVVDALGSPELAERLKQEIAKITPLPIRVLVLTHYHADHIYGLQVFKAAGAHVIAHEAAKEYLNSETAKLRLQTSRKELWPWIDDNTHLVAADEWINAAKTFELGGFQFLIQPVGFSHTPEDVVVYFAQEKVLFSGDLVFRNRIPYVGQANSRHWIEALKDLSQFDVQFMVPGHGAISTHPAQDIQLTMRYLVALRKKMKDAADNMEPFDAAYENADWHEFENVPLFKVANRMNAYNTYLLMEQEAK
jgi:glyoxylase-like metal-dependent hydrolase (beta-lactamase superfamily II)